MSRRLPVAIFFRRLRVIVCTVRQVALSAGPRRLDLRE